MGILAVAADERVKDVNFGPDTVSVELMDGRTITAPLAWYPKLLNATAKERANWTVSGGGLRYPLARARRRSQHRGSAAGRAIAKQTERLTGIPTTAVAERATAPARRCFSANGVCTGRIRRG